MWGRDSGYSLIFFAALPGLALYIGSYLVLLEVIVYCDSRWCEVVTKYFFTGPDLTYLATSLIIGILFSFAVNTIIWPSRAWFIAVGIRGDQKHKLLRRSIREKWLLEFTLNNGKSYVGWVLGVDYAIDPGNNINILPIFSGYRHTETRRLHFTEDYYKVIFDSPLMDQDENKIGVTFSLSEAVSIRPFDLDLYLDFRDNTDSPYIDS